MDSAIQASRPGVAVVGGVDSTTLEGRGGNPKVEKLNSELSTKVGSPVGGVIWETFQ